MQTPEQNDSAEQTLSKTRRKALMDELQALGVTLVGLPKEKLAKLALPERLLEAIQEAKRINSNGATRRQMQYIGKLMREIDTAPIVDQLQRWEGKHNAENAYFHQLERWRSRLIEDDAALSVWMEHYPDADSQQLRTLIRNARRETAAGKPPKSSRDLFKLLREISQPANPAQQAAEADMRDEDWSEGLDDNLGKD